MNKAAIIILIAILFSTSAYALRTGVSIENWQYDPVNITIGSGMTVTWINNEVESTHRVIIRGLGASSQLLFPGNKFNYTFEEPGTYQFYDSASAARLKGNVIVIPKEEFTYCGDNICNEDKATCCTDCGCDADYYCFNNVCVPEKKVELTVQPAPQPEITQETKPTDYTILIFGSITVVALLFIFILIRVIKKK